MVKTPHKKGPRLTFNISKSAVTIDGNGVSIIVPIESIVFKTLLIDLLDVLGNVIRGYDN